MNGAAHRKGYWRFLIRNCLWLDLWAQPSPLHRSLKKILMALTVRVGVCLMSLAVNSPPTWQVCSTSPGPFCPATISFLKYIDPSSLGSEFAVPSPWGVLRGAFRSAHRVCWTPAALISSCYLPSLWSVHKMKRIVMNSAFYYSWSAFRLAVKSFSYLDYVNLAEFGL